MKVMNVYEINDIGELLRDNPYAGRGIVIGQTEDGSKAVVSYFIMGRSDNSRNRVFIEEGEDVAIHPYDETKVEDPSLIIYHPLRKIDNTLIVTNGDQTDTIYEALKAGSSFEAALESRCFEPDSPNFTPRISGVLHFCRDGFRYKMSILKSADAIGSACNRFTFSYAPLRGVGHFIHTYVTDGNPIPSFTGEPARIMMPNEIDVFTDKLWQSLNDQNKISLYVRYIDIASGKTENRIINKNHKRG